MDTDEFITSTMHRVADAAVPPPPGTPRPAPTRRWVTPYVVAAVVVTVIVAVATTIGLHRSNGGPDAASTPTGSPTAAPGCRFDYAPKPLPGWARGGFSPPTQTMPYVLGDRGRIAAILWATHHPLVSPPRAEQNNKILWVARVGPTEGPLRVRATLAGTGETATRTIVDAPGPSVINLPSAGCWSLHLTWGTHHDHLVLGYADR